MGEHDFFMASNLNDFKLVMMEKVQHGLYRYLATLPECPWMWFQIVVDENWKKALYPSKKDAGAGEAMAKGPDSKGHGLNWQVSGRPGDVYEIVLDLTQEDKHKRVTWKLQ